MSRFRIFLMALVFITGTAWADGGLTGPFLTATLEPGATVLTGFTPVEGAVLPGTAGPVVLKRVDKLTLPAGDGPVTMLAACYLDAPSFQELTIQPADGVTLRLFLDDRKAKAGIRLPIRTGKHKLIMLLQSDGKAVIDDPVTLSGFNGSISLTPERPLSHLDYAAIRTPGWFTLSPDGRFAAVSVSWRDARGKRQRELQVADLHAKPTKKTVLDGASSPVFSPDGRTLYYLNGKTLMAMNPATGSRVRLRTFDDRISGLTMGPEGRFLYFTLRDTWKPDKKGDYELLTEMRHKRPDWKSQSFLMAVSTDGTMLRKLAGPANIGSWDIRNGKVLMVVSEPLDRYPWSRSQVQELDLATLESRTVATYERGLSDIRYRNQDEVVVVSQRKPYDDARPANFYDTALFSLSLADGTLTPLTGDAPFAMGIDIVYTRQTSDTLSVAPDGTVTFIATLHGRGTVFRLKGNKLKQLDTPAGMVTGFSTAGGALTCMVSDINRYPVLMRDNRTVLDFQDRERMAPVRLADYQSLDFQSESGYTIHNHLIYPAGYVKGKTYPMLVFYYGGVIPCGPVFHPTFQWLAGNGYFVLITTPRGAVGRGDRFADEHVNEWGEKSAADLIEAAEWIADHVPGVDKDRIGAYSGSYGGFLAMSLATKTTLFKALISEYGISNIASYWGAGYWGYLYGMSALGGSYPWNARNVYVDKSPLFNADRIRTPLLLMHGDADVNVPVGESDQMFTALKVLGKDTAYVRFFGEDHGMKGKFSNWLAQEDFVMAWFDRYLKGEPAFWDYLVKKTRPVPKHEPMKDYFFYGEKKDD